MHCCGCSCPFLYTPPVRSHHQHARERPRKIPVGQGRLRLDKLIDAVLIAVLVVFLPSYAHAEEFFARLNGFEELGAQNNETGAILSNGSGTLRLSLDKKPGAATFTLTFSDVGTTPPKTGTVTQAHIHFGKVHSAGGVMVFFC